MRCLAIVAFVFPVALVAQAPALPPETAPTAPVVLTRGEEVALARTAAPAAVAKDARVWVLEHGRYVIADSGRSGVACLVSRSQRLSLEPECGDDEAEETVLAIERFRVEQRIAGRSAAEIDRAMADSIASGRFRLPRRPAMVYMMSSSQILYDDEGTFVGRWMPHLMIYFPFLRDTEIGLPAGFESLAAPIVDKPGTPLSNIMVVMRSFATPAPTP
jgi:hypothetical protein